MNPIKNSIPSHIARTDGVIKDKQMVTNEIEEQLHGCFLPNSSNSTNHQERRIMSIWANGNEFIRLCLEGILCLRAVSIKLFNFFKTACKIVINAACSRLN